MLIRNKIISLILLSSLAISQVTFCSELSFFDQVTKKWTNNQKDPSPIAKKAYDLTVKQLEKIKKQLPGAVREVVLTAIATLIGKFIYDSLIKKPIKAAKSVAYSLLFNLYISQALSILADKHAEGELIEKAIKNSVNLSTAEQIALVGMYIKDDGEEITAKELKNEETVEKIISGELVIDKKHVKKMVLSILEEQEKASEKRKAAKIAAQKKSAKKKESSKGEKEIKEDKNTKPKNSEENNQKTEDVKENKNNAQQTSTNTKNPVEIENKQNYTAKAIAAAQALNLANFKADSPKI